MFHKKKDKKDKHKKYDRYFTSVGFFFLGILFYVVLNHISTILSAIGNFISFFSPVVVGGIIAYILNPVSNIIYKFIYKFIKQDVSKRMDRILNIFSTIVTIFLFVGLVIGIIAILVPQVLSGISIFLTHFDEYMDAFRVTINRFVTLDEVMIHKNDVLSRDDILRMFSDTIHKHWNELAKSSVDIGTNIFMFGISIVMAIYFMVDADHIFSNFSKFLKLLLKKEDYESTIDFISKCDDILIRYIGLSIIDAFIIGISTFIFMIIFQIPYAGLVAIVVGVTNLAPTFGPIAGGFIGSFIIILSSPEKVVLFLVFILLIQLLDGQFLKPKLFGDSFGVSSLLILAALTVGGRIFGVTGILLSIPFVAIIDFAYKDYILPRLIERKKEMMRKEKKECKDKEEKGEDLWL